MFELVLRAMQVAAIALPPLLLVFDAPFGKFGLPSAWNVHGTSASVRPC